MSEPRNMHVDATNAILAKAKGEPDPRGERIPGIGRGLTIAPMIDKMVAQVQRQLDTLTRTKYAECMDTYEVGVQDSETSQIIVTVRRIKR